ncbi:MAG TPA: GntR family transcriptional regulator [Bryobacteraceae bacterium]|nr:GntR family transcriptional regulator [Bryobacteraceae bacterium]
MRDQLTTQLMLGIATGELPPGTRLPSTRMLARRFRLHPNTVSAAYRQLEKQRWVESVRGSGVYVIGERAETQEARLQTLDDLVLDFLRSARKAGLPAKALHERIAYWLATPPEYFLFVHPDRELREIVCAELKPALTLDVAGCDLDPAALNEHERRAVFLCMPSHRARAGELLPRDRELITLEIRRVASELAQFVPSRKDVLVVIASKWAGFLNVARTMLTAAGYAPEALLFRNARLHDWDRGVQPGMTVVCDVLTSDAVPSGVHKIVFPLISDACISELRSYERFWRGRD